MAAQKMGFPNQNKLPPVRGSKNNSGKSTFPNQPHIPHVKAGSKTPVPNTGSGPKQPGKMTARAPSVKAPLSAGPARGTVDSAKVGGLLGNLKVGRLGR